ncbi:hypothetical protein GJ496_001072, partial [Pomphorhynchus laevis]
MSDCTTEEIELYVNDQKYRSFSNAIEKILKNFDSSSEWADLISNLAKLEKIIEANNKYCFIPKRITVARRLSQCLHPNLPTGVHLKSLSVYNSIMQSNGDQLCRDLSLYCPPILYLLPRSSFTVRPRLLHILEKYIVKYVHASSDLPSILASIFASIEESSELTDRILELADSILQRSEPIDFYSAGWTALTITMECRLPYLRFLSSKLERGDVTVDIVTSTDPNEIVIALCHCLQDQTPHRLICRTALDLICQLVPMDSNIFPSQAINALLSNAFNLLLLKESSLNRRVMNWMLGCKNWDVCGSKLFSGALMRYINDSLASNVTNSLLTTVSTLLDQSQLTAFIVQHNLFYLLLKVHKHCQLNDTLTNTENLNSLSSFLLSFDTHFLWTFISDKICELLHNADDSVDLISLCMLLEDVLSSHNN